MPTRVKIQSRGPVGWVLRFWALSVLLATVAYGRVQQSQPEKLAYGADPANIPDAIAKVKSGHFAGIHVDLIARGHAVEAIPILQEQYSHVEDPLLKAKIASALVKLGDKDETYWNFLVKLATDAVESNMPDLMAYDSQGKVVQSPSPEFIAWAEANSIKSEEQLNLLRGAVGFLALTGDARAVPLLRRALSSSNYLIVNLASEGLAEIGDKESIPLIIEACKRAPADSAAAIAEALVYFDDPRAQEAVDQFIPKDRAKIYRDGRAHGRGPFGTYPLEKP